MSSATTDVMYCGRFPVLVCHMRGGIVHVSVLVLYRIVPFSSTALSCCDFFQTGLKWPSGTYGLPKPVDGCPIGDGFEWKTGYRFHDTEDDGTENQHSDSFHLAGEFSDVGIRHEFCIKTTEDGGGR